MLTFVCFLFSVFFIFRVDFQVEIVALLILDVAEWKCFRIEIFFTKISQINIWDDFCWRRPKLQLKMCQLSDLSIIVIVLILLFFILICGKFL